MNRAEPPPQDLGTAGPPAPLGHQPGLDGVRGVAIGLVLLAHWTIPGGAMLLPGGAPNIGVDVFFVLSGFLITRLLLDEAIGAGWIRLAGFWARRGLRLLPCSTLVIVVVWIVGIAFPSAFYHSGAEVSPSRAALAALAYHMNWLQAFPATHHDWALTATWSLSLEEQFYAVWPLIVSACVLGSGGAHHVFGRRVAIASVSIALGSMAVRAWLVHQQAWDHVYNGLDARAGQLCAGSLLAALSTTRPALLRIASRFAPLGLLGIALVAGWKALDRRFFGLGYDIVAGMSVAVIAGAVVAEGWVGRLLKDERLVWLGLRAYSIYLVHYPVYMFMTCARISWAPGWTVLLVRQILVLGVADLLHRYVERPILGLRRRYPLFAVASRQRSVEDVPARGTLTAE